MYNATQNLSRKILPKTEAGVLAFLESFGRISADASFDERLFLDLATQGSEKVRTLAIKNLAKLEKKELLEFYIQVVKDDPSTTVKREAVSAIGRMRDRETISHLLDILKSSDPKVTLQAIRGLLVFKNEQIVSEQLLKLKEHPNEMIREMIEKEISYTGTSFDKNHAESPDFMKNVAIHGDVLKVLQNVPNESIHLTFTSPPYYNARDYSIYQKV